MLYSVPAATPTAMTAAYELFEGVAPSDAVVCLHALEIGQTTELGDASEEQLLVTILSGATSSGNGSSVTPASLESGQAAAGGTYERNAATPASGGTIVTRAAKPWNVRAPFLWLPPPEQRIYISPSVRFTVQISTPADSISVFGELIIEEIGG